jgi:uncharacterized protein
MQSAQAGIPSSRPSSPNSWLDVSLTVMTKLLLFFAVLAVVYALFRASSRRSRPPPAAPAAETMARCANCGVHFPRAESATEGGQDYCCAEHRRLGARP